MAREGVCLRIAVKTVFPYAQPTGCWGPLAFGAAMASWARAGGSLVPGGLQRDMWSRHFPWTLPSCFRRCHYSMLNGKGPVCPGLVQTL